MENTIQTQNIMENQPIQELKGNEKWTPDQKNAVREIMKNFTDSNTGFIQYNRIKNERPDLWKITVIDRGGDEILSKRRLQQRISAMRSVKLTRFQHKKNTNKTKHSETKHTENFKKFQLSRSITEPKITSAIQSAVKKKKFELNMCPNCGCGLKELQVALNIVNEN